MKFGHKIAYTQTWEDFDVDKSLLDIKHEDSLLTISSGGCNVLNACILNPKKIFAVDSNPAQNYLLRLKIAGIKTLSYPEFWEFFGEGQSEKNIDLYFQKVRQLLPDTSKTYWDKNIGIFKSGIFKTGSLETLSLLRKSTQHLCGLERLSHFCKIEDLNDQASYYIQEIEPRLWQNITSYVPIFTMIAYGVHLRQVYFCYQAKKYYLKDLYKDKQHHLFTKIPIKSNYFWHQIFLGAYSDNTNCPDYLKKENFEILKKNVGIVNIIDSTVTDFLKTQKNNSINKFSISDVIEFSSASQTKKIWSEIIRTAEKDALVSYRSFAPNIFPSADLSDQLHYFDKESKSFTDQERTASYSNVYKFKIIK